MVKQGRWWPRSAANNFSSAVRLKAYEAASNVNEVTKQVEGQEEQFRRPRGSATNQQIDSAANTTHQRAGGARGT
jgi:hypothetical protein